jgi:transporter family-2 protein
MRYFTCILALLAGAALSLESAFLGELGKTVGELESSFYSFAMGAVIMGLIWLYMGKGNLAYAFAAPKWQLAGGALGAVYLTLIIISVPYVGVGITMVAVIIGQLVMSMLIEHYGWLGSTLTRLNTEKVLAVASMVVALCLIH